MLQTTLSHPVAASFTPRWRLLWRACAMTLGRGVLEQIRLPPASAPTAGARARRLVRYARISAW